MHIPDIKGDVLDDEQTRDRYSSDMSGYTLRPKLVVLPSDEDDVQRLVEFAQKEALPITPRGAGSNLSGSAVGSGLVLNFKHMAALLDVNKGVAVLQPGVVYRDLNEHVAPEGLTLRYDVSSGGFSTLGGNIATKAGGLRSIKYGNADESVKSLRFVCPSYGLVDTSLNLPSPLEQEIVTLRKKLIEDESSRMWLMKRKGLKSSSGYNLHALIDYSNPADIVTHLMAGSVGTLGVFTQLTVKLVPVPAKRFFCVAFFRDILDAVEAAPSLVELHPSALEAMDSFGTDLIGKDIGLSVPPPAGATLLMEWDEQDEERVKTASSLLAKSSLDFSWIEEVKTIDALWKIRWTMLTRLKKMHEDAEHRYLSFVDDMAVPLQRLHPFMREIKNIFQDEGLDAVIFGHIGEGNLHIRPLIGKRGWQRVIRQVGERCFTAVLSHGGTLTAEHGTGRNRAPYLKQEWGEGLYPLFREVKHIFDAEDVLNRGVMFTSHDITHNLRF